MKYRIYKDNPITKIRKYLGLSQADLGLLIDKPRSAIKSFEEGHKIPDINIIQELNRLLDDIDIPELKFTEQDLIEWRGIKRESIINYFRRHHVKEIQRESE